MDSTIKPSSVRCSRCGREVKADARTVDPFTSAYLCRDRVACDKARKEEAK